MCAQRQDPSKTGARFRGRASALAPVLLDDHPPRVDDLSDVRREWLRSMDGRRAGDSVRTTIRESWLRSSDGAARAQDAQLVKVSEAELTWRLEQSHDLVEFARPQLEWMSHAMGTLAHVVYVVDCDGIVLASTGSDPDKMVREGLIPGYDWSEHTMGTNGAGTAMATDRPVAVVGPEHYCQAFHGAICTGAPIHDADGAIIGAVDLSVGMIEGTPSRLAFVAQAARIIEQSLLHLNVQRQADSARLLREVMDQAPVMLWQTDATSECTWVNQRWQEFTGLGDQHGVIEQWIAAIHPEDRAESTATYYHAFEHREEFAMEYRMRRDDGVYRWLLSTGVPRYVGPDFVGFVGTCVDITERKEAALTASHLAAIVESSTDAIWSVDLHGDVTSWNVAAHRLYGWSPSHVLGEPARAVVGDEHADDFQRALVRVGAGHRVPTVETRVVTRDGQHVEVERTLSPIYDDNAEIVGASIVERDVSQEKSLFREMEAARAANEAKTKFLASISHDIRSPMTVIKGYGQLLSREIDDPRHLKLLDAILRNGDYLLDVLGDVLDLSRIEEGKLSTQRERIAIDALLDDVAVMMAQRAHEVDVELEFASLTPLPRIVFTDATHLRQILVNLLSNAIKFTPADGRVWLDVGVDDAQPTRLQFAVHDTGVGMTPTQIERIFEPFVTSGKDANGKRCGFGLGLTITQRLVEALGGTIRVDSTPGQGTTFRFDIDHGGLEDAGELSSLRL